MCGLDSKILTKAVSLWRDPVGSQPWCAHHNCWVPYLAINGREQQWTPIWYNSLKKRSSQLSVDHIVSLPSWWRQIFIFTQIGNLPDVDMPPWSVILLPAPLSTDLRHGQPFITLVTHKILILIKKLIS